MAQGPGGSFRAGSEWQRGFMLAFKALLGRWGLSCGAGDLSLKGTHATQTRSPSLRQPWAAGPGWQVPCLERGKW